MKTILTYGTFDVFHVGHVRLLKRLSEMADRLIVGVSTDEFNTQKGKEALMSYSDRAEVVSACQYVDLVFEERSWAQKENDIERFSVDIFAIGDDWQGKFDHLKKFCEVKYLPRTSGISSTSLKKLARGINRDNIKDLEKALSTINSVIDGLK